MSDQQTMEAWLAEYEYDGRDTRLYAKAREVDAALAAANARIAELEETLRLRKEAAVKIADGLIAVNARADAAEAKVKALVEALRGLIECHVTPAEGCIALANAEEALRQAGEGADA